LQFDGRAFPDSPLAPNDTFGVRKIRPILAGTVLGLTDFFFSPDFGNLTTPTSAPFVSDAYLDTHPRPWLRIRVGKFKQPYGLERLQAFAPAESSTCLRGSSAIEAPLPT
jgi:phosphate-selective porin OprO and OprP